MKIDCIHFSGCSGCVLASQVEHPKSLDEVRLFFSTYQIGELLVQTGAAEGWRCRARLSVRGTPGKPLIGLYREGTHKVVDIPSCKIHHPLINRAVQLVRNWIQQEQVSIYDEKSGTGLLRYLQLTVSPDQQTVQLVLVLNCDTSASLDGALFERLFRQTPELWHSLWINFNTRRDNLILGEEWSLVCGEPWLIIFAQGKRICLHPESFMQANLQMFGRLLRRLGQIVPQNAAVVEFYAGAAAIGLSLLDRCRTVACVEIAPIANRCFEASCESLSAEEKARITFHTGSAASQTALLSQPWDVIIVDPPRKGLDPQFLQALCALKGPKQLIYISCGWASFKRDCTHLLKAGWRLSSAELFLFFPGSEHLELLAVFKID